MSMGGLTKGVVVTTLIAIAAVIIITTYLTSNFYVLPEQSTVSEYSIVDILGRNVTLPKNVTRVVAIGPGVLRLVCYLKAYDLLVGVEESEIRWGPVGRDYAMALNQVLTNLPVIGPGGPGKPPAPELILTVKPDLIIMSRVYAEMYDPDRLQKETNSTVIVVDYGPAGQLDLEALTNALRILGKALNRGERAEELIRFIESIRSDLEIRTKDISSRPKVYVGAISYKGPQPFTTSQTAFPPLTLLHTPSIVDRISNQSGVLFLDFEVILKEQPDVVFIDLNNLNTVKQDFDKDPLKYLHLSAFKSGRVYGILPYNYYHTNIAVALADAYYMGKVLYLDRFADIDPVVKADEIFNVFLGKPLYHYYAEYYGGFRNLSEFFGVRTSG
ncbi:MAG: ABC transporter substrate-binding protein [Sulfolobales archaeon]